MADSKAVLCMRRPNGPQHNRHSTAKRGGNSWCVISTDIENNNDRNFVRESWPCSKVQVSTSCVRTAYEILVRGGQASGVAVQSVALFGRVFCERVLV